MTLEEMLREMEEGSKRVKKRKRMEFLVLLVTGLLIVLFVVVYTIRVDAYIEDFKSDINPEYSRNNED